MFSAIFRFHDWLKTFPLRGDVYGRLSIAGNAQSPQLRLLLNTGNTFFNNEKLNLETALYYEDLKLKVERISASYDMYRFYDVDGLLDLENGSHSLTGEILSESSLLNFSGTLSASADTPAADSISSLPSILSEDFTAKINVDNIALNQEQKNPWRFDILKRGEMLNLTGGTGSEINGSMFEDGNFILTAEKPFPIGISASGTLKDGQITASLKDINYNFDDLNLGKFSLYSGEVTGQLRIQGQANDPDFYGQLDFNGIELQVPVVLDITKPFNTSFFFSGKEITAPATRAYTETGLIYVNATASMERWLPSGYDLDIRIPEGNPVAARYYKNSIFLSGYTTGELDIYGDLTRLNIEGNINASGAVFMLNDDLDYPKGETSKITIISKLKCTLGENNQFFWPSQDLPIVKSFLGGKSELDLTYEPSSGIVLNGDLKLDGGEIFYFQKNFYIKEGELKFINVQKGDINPLLSARAEIRDINTEGEMSRIYLIVDQSPLNSFVPRFESDPTMSTAEIMALLGGNIFDSFESSSDVSSIESATLLVTDIFTQFALLKSVEDNLKSTFGLDLLSIRSSFLSNFIENTLFTPSDELSGDNFVNYLDNTTLFLGKYFTDDIFLQGMFQFDLYDDTGYSEDPELNFDSEITLEWEGPVANVELSFYPDFKDPVAGLNKTSVGLSWRFSY